MSATTTPLPAGSDIGETIAGKVYNRAILFDGAGAAVQPATATKQDEAKGAIQALGVQGAAFTITPHATDPLERPIGGISIVTGGTIVFRYPGEAADRTVTLPAGFFPLVASHIRAISTASGLTGF